MTLYEGDLRQPDGTRFAILASRWNARITDTLVAGARQCLADNGVPEAAIDVVRLPGARQARGRCAQERDTYRDRYSTTSRP